MSLNNQWRLTQWGFFLAYIAIMSHQSVADAKNRLSELLDRARAGDEVVITRHSRPWWN